MFLLSHTVHIIASIHIYSLCLITPNEDESDNLSILYVRIPQSPPQITGYLTLSLGGACISVFLADVSLGCALCAPCNEWIHHRQRGFINVSLPHENSQIVWGIVSLTKEFLYHAESVLRRPDKLG